MTKAMKAAMQRHIELTCARFMRDTETPVEHATLLSDLEQLAILADSGVWEARDEAEKLLLRYISDPDITQAYYEVRRRCS